MSADILLSRLERVRKCGRGWIARCPAHEDKSASLSIAEADNGTVLLHDFAGCAALDIVQAVGLNLGDLFPKREWRGMTAAERAEMRTLAMVPKWKAATNVAVHEIGVVCAVLADLSRTRKLTPANAARITHAWELLEAARGELGFAPEKRRAA